MSRSSPSPIRFAVVIFLAGIWGCQRSKDPAANTSSGSTRPIHAVVTVGMVADLVQHVGQDRVRVTQICGSGVDPHLYNPTTDDVKTILSSDVVFYSGLMLEGKLADALNKVGKSKPVVAVTEKIDPATLLEPDDFPGHPDPHVWMDVSAWSSCVPVIVQQLSMLDPDSSKTYEANGKAYQEQLAELHDYGKASLATIPESQRLLITSHDAFNYFGRAYDLEVQGVQGLSTESEAGLQRINDLVDVLVERDIQAVFIESSVPRKNIDALIEGAQAKGKTIKIGGELFSDAMGKKGEYEGTYIGMLDHNITTVTIALGGRAPEKGLNKSLDSHVSASQP